MVCRPQLRPDLPEGGPGVWALLKWLLADVGPSLCQQLIKGQGDIKPDTLTSAAFRHAVGQDDFKTLYDMHSVSPLADDLVSPETNTSWDFDLKTIQSNPFALLLYRIVRTYVRSSLISLICLQTGRIHN